MLPDHITQLLSAYVDGELNSRERKNVTRILRKSSEARQLLHKLKQDSMILRHLPRKKTQLDLTESAMGTLSLRGIHLPKVDTTPLAPPPVSKRLWSPRLVVAVVVTVLLTVALVSYLFFSVLFRGAAVGISTETDPGASGGSGALPGHSAHELPEGPPPVIAVLHEPDTPDTPPKGSNPPKDDRARLAVIRSPHLAAAQPRLMSILPLQDLDQDATAQRVVQQLKKDGMSRLDLFCKVDTLAVLDQLQDVFKEHNVTLRRDAYAQARIKQRMRTNFAVYCEDLTADEFGVLLQQLAQEDRKAAHFDRLTINPLTPAEIAGALGGEPSFYQIHDVAAQTGHQVARSLTGQAKADPAEAASNRSVNHLAVAVPYLPQPGYTREVRYIVENRPKEWRPGVVQVLLVLWNK